MNMKNIRLFLVAILSLCLFAACEKNNEDGVVDNQVPVEGVTLDHTSLEMMEGEVAVLVAEVQPENADNKNVVWTSSDDDIATVDNGTVTAVSAGECVVSVITEDGGKTADCHVSVEARIPVENMTISTKGMIIKVGETFVLRAVFTPENATNQKVVFTSGDDAVATVDETGLVTGISEGSTYIQVESEEGGIVRQCQIIVSNSSSLRCNTETPGWGEELGEVYFATDQTWIIGNQEWSDAVVLANGDKESFNGGSIDGELGFYADARSNPGYKGTLFSWCAVFRYQDQLCPDGWRVPTSEDFTALDIALGGTGANTNPASHLDKYSTEWGGEFPGYCGNAGVLLSQDFDAEYWSITESSEKEALYLGYKRNRYVGPLSSFDKGMGFTLRCVKDLE